MSNTNYKIDPRFQIATKFYSIDTANHVLTHDVDHNVIARATEVFNKSMTMHGGNDLENMRNFFTNFVLLGTKTAKRYPAPILPGLMSKYGVQWRDFGTESGNAQQDQTRGAIIKTALWMCAAYWLTPDWLYNANYPELINYRRWINPRVLSYQPWGDAVRANPCIFEETLRESLKPWFAKVLDPLIAERQRWALKHFGKGREPKDVKLAIPAVFYKRMYEETLKPWYEEAQGAWGGRGVPVVQEIPKRETQRRVSQKRSGEQMGTRTSSNKSTAPVVMAGNTGKTVRQSQALRDVTDEHRKRDPMGSIYNTDAPPPGGSTRAVSWSKIDANGKTAAQWLNEALDAGLREAMLTIPADKRWSAIWGAYRSRQGSKAEDDNMRSLIQRIDAVPATGPAQTEAEYAELQAAHEEAKGRLRYDLEVPEVEVRPRYEDVEELDEAELAREEAREEARRHAERSDDVPPPPGGAAIPWAQER